MKLFRLTGLSLFLPAALTLFAADPRYRSVEVDPTGRLHIVFDSGKEVLPPKLPGQTSFGGPVISDDRLTIGWLAQYPDPTITYYKGAQIGGSLVIFRHGRVVHKFTTERMFWDWQFQDGGKRVAYSTGPTHGGAAECVLRDVETGRTVERWRVKEGEAPPSWAQTLQR
jgi:hypothetical protein